MKENENIRGHCQIRENCERAPRSLDVFFYRNKKEKLKVRKTKM